MEKEDIPTAFWRKWSSAGLDEQIEMMKHTLIGETLANYFKMTSKMKDKDAFYEDHSARIINDLFLDLYMFLETEKQRTSRRNDGCEGEPVKKTKII